MTAQRFGSKTQTFGPGPTAPAAVDLDPRGPLVRENDGVLAAGEQIILAKIVARLPPWVTPDDLTLFGLAGAILIFIGYAATTLSAMFLFLASLGLVINWAGDSLDGSLARYRRCERPRIGFFLDHTTDLLSQILTGVGLGLSVYVRAPFAFLLLSIYLAFAAYTFIRARVFSVVKITYFSIGPTEVRLMLMLANFGLFFIPWMSRDMYGVSASPIDAVLAGLAIISSAAFLRQIYEDLKVLHAQD